MNVYLYTTTQHNETDGKSRKKRQCPAFYMLHHHEYNWSTYPGKNMVNLGTIQRAQSKAKQHKTRKEGTGRRGRGRGRDGRGGGGRHWITILGMLLTTIFFLPPHPKPSSEILRSKNKARSIKNFIHGVFNHRHSTHHTRGCRHERTPRGVNNDRHMAQKNDTMMMLHQKNVSGTNGEAPVPFFCASFDPCVSMHPSFSFTRDAFQQTEKIVKEIRAFHFCQ